jgi:hypothetical protein
MSGIAPEPPASASPEDRPPPDDLLDLEGRAVLDFLRGEYAAARGPTPTIQPEQVEPQGKDAEPTRHDSLIYLPAASHCYAIVQYDTASARVVRRVVGLFGDADCAETYARLVGYHLYDVVPATAVIPKAP